MSCPSDSNTFCTLNPPVSPTVSRSSSLLEWMAWWDIPGMAAACGMNKHMASLSSDNGEAEGSCPEPAGNRAVVCQPLCNSYFKEALTSPSGLFWEQPGWAIIITGSPGRLGVDRGEVYWGELIDSCLITWLSLTGKPCDWKRMTSEEAHAKEGPRGRHTCWVWGPVSRLPRLTQVVIFQHAALTGSWPVGRLCCLPAWVPELQWWRTLRIQTLWCHFAPKPQCFTFKSWD